MSDGEPTGGATNPGERTGGDDSPRTMTVEEHEQAIAGLKKRISQLAAAVDRKGTKAKDAESALDRIATVLGGDASDLDALIEGIESRRNGDDKAKSFEARLRKMETQYQEALQTLDSERKERRSERLRNEFLTVATTESNDPDVLFSYLRSRFSWDDDGQLQILDSDGQPSVDLDLKKLITQTLEDKPHLRRPPPGQGAGSHAPGSRNNSAERPGLDKAGAWLAERMPQGPFGKGGIFE